MHNERDLGVFVDSSLSFKPHTKIILGRALKLYGWMARNLTSRDETIISIYKVLIRPMLEYASTIWSPSRVGIMNSLERVQRKVTKLVVRLRSLSYSDRLRELHLPTLEWRRNYLDLLKVFQILHGNVQYRKDLFSLCSEVSSSNLRKHRLSIYKNACHTDVYKHHFVNRTVDHWNSLPNWLLDLTSFDLFKSQLKAYLLISGRIDPYRWEH